MKILLSIYIVAKDAVVVVLKDIFVYRNILTLFNFFYSCRRGPLRPDGFVDLCEHCMKILDERKLKSNEYKKVHAVLFFHYYLNKLIRI